MRCIGQEFQIEVSPTSRKVDRLSRMESMVEQLVRLRQTGGEMPDILRRDQPDQHENANATTTGSGPDLESELEVTNDFDKISCALLAVWPNQHDLDLILSIPVGVSVLLHGVVCRPYSGLFSEQIVSPRRMLQPPPPEYHPVLIARRLLLLATLLQGISPSSVDKLAGLSLDYRTIMLRVFNAATRLVTSNDELVGSLEGIECVMIESMYLNNAGNLRRAWLANRRAMATAQMMGLHTGKSSPNLILEDETRDRIYPNYMWFRLVVSDRYLSLMLGLPQGSLENIFASPEALDGCSAVERMERMLSVAGGHVLQRNSVERTDLEATYKIDRMLQAAAALMPPQWWMMSPNLSAIAGNDEKAFEESIRLTNQFAYYHTLVQLHLPYMMLPSSVESSYDYSKMTAASASRTIVSQFLSFRNSFLANAYCRGIDFLAFIASTTLCLAHIEARRQQNADSSNSLTVFQSLQHQRLSDRGLLERTLEVMESMAQSARDVVARKIAGILRPLLAIEDNSFKGGYYHISASPEPNTQESQCLGDPNEAFHALHIQIPYFGTIQIEHRSILPDTSTLAQVSSNEWPQDPSISLSHEPPSPRSRERGGLAPIAHPPGYEISTSQPVNADWQIAPSYFNPAELPGAANQDQLVSSLTTSDTQEAYLLVPGLAADVDDWALQGVDTALFTNLTGGSVDSTESRYT